MKPWTYFDTSAIVKLYVEEAGTAEVRRLFAARRPVSSVILPLETLSAFSRRHSEGSLSAKDFQTVLGYFRSDRGLLDWIALTDPVRSAAESILLARPLRTLDAIHVGSALTLRRELGLESLEFVTADRKQKAGADGLGLEAVFVGEGG